MQQLSNLLYATDFIDWQGQFYCTVVLTIPKVERLIVGGRKSKKDNELDQVGNTNLSVISKLKQFQNLTELQGMDFPWIWLCLCAFERKQHQIGTIS